MRSVLNHGTALIVENRSTSSFPLIEGDRHDCCLTARDEIPQEPAHDPMLILISLVALLSHPAIAAAEATATLPSPMKNSVNKKKLTIAYLGASVMAGRAPRRRRRPPGGLW